jgi:DNA-binding response OmpR family regulator
MRVLIVEDDQDLCEAAVATMRSAGFAVDVARDWSGADQALAVNDYDCMVLDRRLPDGDGATHLHRGRARGLRVPTLMLTALSDVADRVVGFEAGADDYLGKPFATAELIARVRALCRRSTATQPVVLRVHDLELDSARREVRLRGVLNMLTPKEFSVLEQLMHRAPAAVSRAELREHCRDEHADPLSNVVDVVVTQPRRKLGNPNLIHTVRGFGYRIGDPEC